LANLKFIGAFKVYIYSGGAFIVIFKAHLYGAITLGALNENYNIPN
jgi:hypothetical protein